MKTWWPNGYGEAVLYLATISYDGASGDFDQKSIHIGFRTVELVQDDVSSGELLSFITCQLPRLVLFRVL